MTRMPLSKHSPPVCRFHKLCWIDIWGLRPRTRWQSNPYDVEPSSVQHTPNRSSGSCNVHKWHKTFVITVFLKHFCWTKVHFVVPLIAPILDFVWPSPWVPKPGWFYCLHTYLLAHGEPKGHIWCCTCLFYQQGFTLYKCVYSRLAFWTSLMQAAEGRQWWTLTWAAVRFDLYFVIMVVNVPTDPKDE